MEKLVFVALLFCVLLPESYACFTSNQTHFTRMRIGSRFYQECKCDDPGSEGVKLMWLDPHDQEILPLRPGIESNVYSEWVDEDTYRLFISSLGRSISGAYKCVTVHNGQTYALTYNVEAYDRPYFINTNETQYVVSGKNVTIFCEARSETDPLIIWYKQDGLTKIRDGDKYETSSQGLIIKGVTNDDKGLYRCAASDLKTGEEIIRDIQVEVISVPKITEIVASPDSNVVAGGILEIVCMATGSPHPEYVWRKIPKYSQPIGNHTFPAQYAHWKQEANRITIYDVNENDAGAYECTASNVAGSSSGSINVDVYFMPEITKADSLVAIEGTTVQIVCRSQGLPIPQMSINYLGDEVDERSIVWDVKNISNIEVEFYLTFLRVNRTHDGFYVCNATNFLATDQREINLAVLYPPHFDEKFEEAWGWSGRNTNLSCDNHSSPPANITWNYQGNDLTKEEQTKINNIMADKIHDNPLIIENVSLYGTYQCIANNGFGEDKKIIVLRQGFVPAAINNVTITNVTATSVTFSINGPEFINGPPIKAYKAEYDEAENYNITDIHINRTWSIDRPFRIDRLRPSTVYYIKFAAINDVGDGPWSEVYDFDTLENTNFRSVPLEPVWETDVEEVAAMERKLKWKQEELVDSYNIRLCPMNNGIIEETVCTDKTIEPAAEFQLNDLDSNTTYYLELIAHNSNGSSTPAHIMFTIPAEEERLLSAGALIGISIVVVFFCLVLLDVVLLLWRKQGIIAHCCNKKKKNKREVSLNSRSLNENVNEIEKAFLETTQSPSTTYKSGRAMDTENMNTTRRPAL
ncbi:fasciclin-2-like isoform X2 [Maniola jurtina]|uniref:fasciclin-2-like isoform X2 n=1 Tax=Maniola jurtina TaxID=191418 RepID=UPI001E68B732|nr:fasciclin-2-like isoform X2 [Maniola jurtina]